MRARANPAASQCYQVEPPRFDTDRAAPQASRRIAWLSSGEWTGAGRIGLSQLALGRPDDRLASLSTWNPLDKARLDNGQRKPVLSARDPSYRQTPNDCVLRTSTRHGGIIIGRNREGSTQAYVPMSRRPRYFGATVRCPACDAARAARTSYAAKTGSNRESRRAEATCNASSLRNSGGSSDAESRMTLESRETNSKLRISRQASPTFVESRRRTARTTSTAASSLAATLE